MSGQFDTELIQILAQITNPSSNINALTEELQKKFYSDKQIVASLFNVVESTNNPQEVRQLAAVEVRKLISRHWLKLNNVERENLKKKLLSMIFNEKSKLLSKSMARIIASITSLPSEDSPSNTNTHRNKGEWSDLSITLFENAQSQSPEIRETAVLTIYSVLESTSDPTYFEIKPLINILSQTVLDRSSLQTRLNSILALGNIAESVDSELNNEEVVALRNLVPSMVEVLKQTIESDDANNVRYAFDVFTTLILVDPKVLDSYFDHLIKFIIEIASNTMISDESRCAAFQFLITAVRYRAILIQSHKLGQQLTTCALVVASQDHEFHGVDGDDVDLSDDEEDDSSPLNLALRMVDYLAVSLPPSQVVDPILTAMPEFMKSSDPKWRRAILLSISLAVGGAPEYMSQHVNEIKPFLAMGFEDKHTMVKIAACKCLASLAESLQSSIVKDHTTYMPILSELLQESSTKYGKAVFTALDSFIEYMDQDSIEPYLPTLMQLFISTLLNPAEVQLKNRVISCVSSAAHASGPAFTLYLDKTIETLKPFLTIKVDPNDKSINEDASTTSVAFEALGPIASAVGKAEFHKYAEPLISYALAALENSDGEMKESLYVFLSVIALLYEEEFAFFLPNLMPHLFNTLKREDQDPLDNYEDRIDDMDDEDFENDNLRINSMVTLEKEIAAATIGDIVVATKANFFPYLQESLTLLSSLYCHYYEGIRKAAISSLSKIAYIFLNESKTHKHDSTITPEILIEIISTFNISALETIAIEDDRLVTAGIMQSISKAIKLSNSDVVGGKLEQYCSEIFKILKHEHPSQVILDDDLDATKNLTEFSEMDEELLDSALELLVALCGAFKEGIWTEFKTAIILLTKLCTGNSTAARVSGIGALAECIEAFEYSVQPFIESIYQLLLAAIVDESENVKSNAAYGFGLLCQFCKSNDIIASYPIILGHLHSMLNSIEGSGRAIANVLGCLARMTSRSPSNVSVDEIVTVIVSRTPLEDAYEEYGPILELFLNLYDSQSPLIVKNAHAIAVMCSEGLRYNKGTTKFLSDEKAGKVQDLLNSLVQE